VAGYTFFIEYGLNLRIEVNSFLTGSKNKKNNRRNDRDKDKNHLPGEDIHQQWLGR